ncbi:auxin-induced protein AUX22-like [Corylus avellana]|uniref:auxin-induced protein AUX22-like n=1 Tax=Corylus avellana TaxID=13451 RepID=UPI00286C4DC2|nr:auxin-induced protein AUX22-like [Corylus avellana]
MAKEVLGLELTELRLGLPAPGGGHSIAEKNEKKRVFSEISGDRNKTQVVGWPPVCSYRKKISLHHEKDDHDHLQRSKIYVKVSMDGAPIMRKIDLSMHKGYSDLAVALEKLFDCFAIGDQALKDAESSKQVPIYEDKDGDWLLVGDVPWGMFIESCKRLRIMKRSDAQGFGQQPTGNIKDSRLSK